MYVLLPISTYIGTYVHIVPLGKVCLSPERVGAVRWYCPLDSSAEKEFKIGFHRSFIESSHYFWSQVPNLCKSVYKCGKH